VGGAAPVLPLGLFRARSFCVASIAGVVYGIASGSILFVNVFFLTQIWHYSPSKAGFSMIPGPVVATFVALFVGRVGSKYGRRPRKELVQKRDALVAKLREEARNATRTHPKPDDKTETMPDLERHR